MILRTAAFASALIAALRFALLTTNLIGGTLAGWLDPVLDIGGLAALAVMAYATLRYGRAALAPGRSVILIAAMLLIGELLVELGVWSLARVGAGAGYLTEAAFAAVLLWAAARAALWLGLFGTLMRVRRAPPAPLAALLPLLSGLRAVLFTATMLSPYLEPGGEMRQLFLSTSSLRSWLAIALSMGCDAAIAWLAGRAARVA